MLMLGVMLAEYLIPWDAYAQDLSMAQQPPSAGHLLGTDRYGRDMLARVLVGGRTSIWGALVVVLLITAIGAHIIRMIPPLIVTKEDCDKAVAIIREAVESL